MEQLKGNNKIWTPVSEQGQRARQGDCSKGSYFLVVTQPAYLPHFLLPNFLSFPFLSFAFLSFTFLSLPHYLLVVLCDVNQRSNNDANPFVITILDQPSEWMVCFWKNLNWFSIKENYEDLGCSYWWLSLCKSPVAWCLATQPNWLG